MAFAPLPAVDDRPAQFGDRNLAPEVGGCREMSAVSGSPAAGRSTRPMGSKNSALPIGKADAHGCALAGLWLRDAAGMTCKIER